MKKAVLASLGIAAALAASTLGGNAAFAAPASAAAPASPTTLSPLPSGMGFTDVVAGGDLVYALGKNGDVYTWGSVSWVGPGDRSSAPVRLPLPAGVTFATIGGTEDQAYGLTADGTAYLWGDGSSVTRVAAPAGVSFSSIRFGISEHGGVTYGLGTNGRLYAWGAGAHGMLGNGSSADSAVPVEMNAPAGVTFASISTKTNSEGYGDFYAVSSDGSIYALGANGSGQLGNGTKKTASGRFRLVKVPTPAGAVFSTVYSGYYYIYALSTTGALYTWGDGSILTPREVSAPGVTFTAVQTSSRASDSGDDYDNPPSALTADGSIYTVEGTAVRVAVKAATAGPFASLAAFTRHDFGVSYGVGRDGDVYAWGDGSGADGLFGNGQQHFSSSTPVKVATPAGVSFVAVYSGYFDTYALSTRGDLYAWGGDGWPLGNGTAKVSYLPKRVIPRSVLSAGAMSISASPRKDDGKVTYTVHLTGATAGAKVRYVWGTPDKDGQFTTDVSSLSKRTFRTTGAFFAQVEADLVSNGTVRFSTLAVAPHLSWEIHTPKISGSAKVGHTLTVVLGNWGPKDMAFSYQWYENHHRITGATGHAFKVPSSLLGKKITVKVTAKKTDYVTIEKTSAATRKVTR